MKSILDKKHHIKAVYYLITISDKATCLRIVPVKSSLNIESCDEARKGLRWKKGTKIMHNPWLSALAVISSKNIKNKEEEAERDG